MSGEYFEPSAPVERDGDVISGADYNSYEQVLPETPRDDRDEMADYAVQAAEQIVAAPVTPEAREKSAAERAYDALEAEVERAMDQGLDGKARRYQLDPRGEIEQAYLDEVAARQAETNHQNAEAIRQAQHEADLARIELISDPEARRRARVELLAREQAANSKRGRRW